MRNIHRSRAQPCTADGKWSDQIDITFSPIITVFLPTKIDVPRHNNNRSARVPLREQQLKNNYNVNKSSNNESNRK
jgi:hypothetical protein